MPSSVLAVGALLTLVLLGGACQRETIPRIEEMRRIEALAQELRIGLPSSADQADAGAAEHVHAVLSEFAEFGRELSGSTHHRVQPDWTQPGRMAQLARSHPRTSHFREQILGFAAVDPPLIVRAPDADWNSGDVMTGLLSVQYFWEYFAPEEPAWRGISAYLHDRILYGGLGADVLAARHAEQMLWHAGFSQDALMPLLLMDPAWPQLVMRRACWMTALRLSADPGNHRDVSTLARMRTELTRLAWLTNPARVHEPVKVEYWDEILENSKSLRDAPPAYFQEPVILGFKYLHVRLLERRAQHGISYDPAPTGVAPEPR